MSTSLKRKSAPKLISVSAMSTSLKRKSAPKLISVSAMPTSLKRKSSPQSLFSGFRWDETIGTCWSGCRLQFCLCPYSSESQNCTDDPQEVLAPGQLHDFVLMSFIEMNKTLDWFTSSYNRPFIVWYQYYCTLISFVVFSDYSTLNLQKTSLSF